MALSAEDFRDLATSQACSTEVDQFRRASATLRFEFVTLHAVRILCETSSGTFRIVLPTDTDTLNTSWPNRIYKRFHGRLHRGWRSPWLALIAANFIWRGMRRTIASWRRRCWTCNDLERPHDACLPHNAGSLRVITQDAQLSCQREDGPHHPVYRPLGPEIHWRREGPSRDLDHQLEVQNVRPAPQSTDERHRRDCRPQVPHADRQRVKRDRRRRPKKQAPHAEIRDEVRRPGERDPHVNVPPPRDCKATSSLRAAAPVFTPGSPWPPPLRGLPSKSPPIAPLAAASWRSSSSSYIVAELND